MTTVNVDLNPALAPYLMSGASCQHGPEAAMTIGLRIAKRGIECDATLCMNCGTVTQGDMTVRDALLSLWETYGWHYKIGKRLCELAKRYNRSLLK